MPRRCVSQSESIMSEAKSIPDPWLLRWFPVVGGRLLTWGPSEDSADELAGLTIFVLWLAENFLVVFRIRSSPQCARLGAYFRPVI